MTPDPAEENRGLVAERFALNLARCKREKGMSLTEIAERAEIHRTHLGLLLRGKRLIRIDTVVKLAGALGVPPNALLEGVRWRPPRGPKSTGRFELTN
jgi:transcriptional regulator with XRE-family HTH domain